MSIAKLTRTVLAALAAAAVAGTFAVATAVPAQAARRHAYHPKMTLSTAQVHTGDAVVIKGKVNLYRGSSRKVYLQFRYDENGTTAWKTLRKLKTSKHGYYSTTTHPGNSRDRDYRIYKPGTKVKRGYSKVIHLAVDPVVTTRIEVVKFRTVTQADPATDMCTAPVVLTAGVNGSVTYTLLDGKVDPTRTVTVPAVDEVDRVGTATTACVTGMKPSKTMEGSPATVAISGHNLAGVTAVTFDDATGTITSVSDPTVVATSPDLPTGKTTVKLTLADTSTVTVGDFSVFPKPDITDVDQKTGALAGGDTITLTGVTLATTSKVTFTAEGTDDIPLSDMPALPAKFTVVDDSTVTVTVPAGLGGKSVIRVTTDFGTTSASYTYKLGSRDGSTFEQAILAEINQRRLSGVTCGTVVEPAVGALTWDGGLSDLAKSHTEDMVNNPDVYFAYFGGISHNTPGLKSANYRYWLAGYVEQTTTEDVAQVASNRTAKYVVDGWVNSPGHCFALMSSSITKAGVGVSTSGSTLDAVVDFQ